jgi:outer membrane immunogenic protein
MKKLALTTVSLLAIASSALAADLPTKKSPPPAPTADWQGLYVGLNAGGIWANNNSLNNTTTLPEQNTTFYTSSAAWLSGKVPASGTAAFIGGGQVGYNFQFINLSKLKLLAGLEADIQGVAPGGTTGSRAFATTLVPVTSNGSNQALISQSATNSLSYIGTVRGRAGIILTPTILLYGTGGLAYGGVNISLQNFAGWSSAWQGGSSSYANTLVGWTAGGGFEWQFKENWSVKGEYLYYDLGNASASVTNYAYPNSGGSFVGSQSNYSARFNGNILRAGVNYHFNWAKPAAVVASY